MTAFYLIAAALVVAAVAVLLWPLLRGSALHAPSRRASNLQILRDQLAELDAERSAGSLSDEQHTSARAELERRVLDEAGDDTLQRPSPRRPGRASAAVLALALPLAAGGLYALLGNPLAFDPILSKPPAQATPDDVEVLVERLAQRMREQPGDPAGWALLGRTYALMQRFEPARDAYRRALELQPGSADLLADYADALAMTQGRRLAGEPQQRIDEALAIDPQHLKALALAGAAAMERGDAPAAVGFWTRARDAAPADSPFGAGLAESLREARAAAGLPPEATPAAAAAASGAQVTVQVALAPALAERVRPDDTLFVFARAAQGPRMPLAIARRRAGELPLTVTLDDAMAMQPELRLSAFDRVVIGARISRSGDATPQPGDLEGLSAALAPKGTVAVTIDAARP